MHFLDCDCNFYDQVYLDNETSKNKTNKQTNKQKQVRYFFYQKRPETRYLH